MVYKRNTLKVLLGPEKLLHSQDDACEANDNDLFVTNRSSARRQPDQAAFGKIGESKVYKRARPAGQAHEPRPKVERYPSGLQLQGAKVDTDSETGKSKDTMVKPVTPGKQTSASLTSKTNSARVNGKQSSASANGKPETALSVDRVEKERSQDASVAEMLRETSAILKPAIQNVRLPRNNSNASNLGSGVSRQFLSDFGLRSDHRPDTFSGHHRRRGVASSDLQRQMEEAAERHIRSCQVAGNVKRSSRANLGVKGLRDTVSPAHTPMSFYSSSDPPSRSMLRSKTFYRSDSNIDKPDVVPYLIQVRKNVATISRPKGFRRAGRGNGPLPEISGRTILVGEGYSP